MGNLNLILCISIVTPLAMMLCVYKGRSRTSLLFLLIGVLVCLFCGELNGLLAEHANCTMLWFKCNVTPLTEEFCKAIPILVYAFLFRPKKQVLLESSIAVGVGFAVLENAFILAGSVDMVSIPLALVRGFGAGMMHGICTLAVGYGMTFIHSKRKLFYTGTTALLAVAAVYHSIYNTLVQSDLQWIGFCLPLATFVPLIVVLKKKQTL